jgi:hypothetical protein
MMRWLSHTVRQIRQAPVLLIFQFLVRMAPKTVHRGIVICDVSGDQSIYGERFATDVTTALDRLSEKTPKLFCRVQHFVKWIARAGIDNQFDYYAGRKLLLLHIDYRQQGLMRREAIMTYMVQVATLAYLRTRDPSVVDQDSRVQRILSKQRAFLERQKDAAAV